MDLFALAHVCHEANRALQAEQARTDIPVAVPWEQLDDQHKSSLVDGVKGVLEGASPEQSHANWLAWRQAQGWVWGPVKDESKKQHPLMVPYEQLSAQDRRKDDLFCAVIHALADMEHGII